MPSTSANHTLWVPDSSADLCRHWSWREIGHLEESYTVRPHCLHVPPPKRNGQCLLVGDICQDKATQRLAQLQRSKRSSGPHKVLVLVVFD
ncbi:hypothetical protein C0Q70_20173 [Pomacea canaliculata]|uniref:Uncharacterized protein n=1 Tax=Pomacea canaliculata TaxID=400727 RepID=A0A2T7NET1_POMCA|nr:hypothetical protein C0Q70_20173 [Pomacea canaliculata]